MVLQRLSLERELKKARRSPAMLRLLFVIYASVNQRRLAELKPFQFSSYCHKA